MHMATDGKIGIGTTSPSRLLTLKGLSKFEATNSTNGWVNYTYTDNTFRMNYNGAGNDEIIFPSTGGICFNGDTAEANALDDYEEGTWTPKVGGQTSSVGHAKYTRIGRFVHVDFDVTNNTGSAHSYISGLPFTFTDYSTWHVAWISDSAGGTNTGGNQIGGLVTSGNMSLRAAGGNTAINILNNQRIIGSAQYQATL